MGFGSTGIVVQPGAAYLAFTGGEPALVGAVPPAGTPMIVRASTAAPTVSNAQGGWNVPIVGSAFPNGITSIQVTVGDLTNATSLVIVATNCTLSNINGVAFNGSNRVGQGSGIRVNYVVIGW